MDKNPTVKLRNIVKHFISPVEAANEFIDPEILEEPAIYPPPEVIAKLEWLKDVEDATPLYERIWTEVKSAEQ